MMIMAAAPLYSNVIESYFILYTLVNDSCC